MGESSYLLLFQDQDPPVAESRSARSSPARGATGSPATPRMRAGRAAQLGSAPSCGAASVVGTQHQRRHSPTWNCAQVLALPGAAGMATMQHELAGKKQGVGGFPLTATIGDNYLCQPHDGATRGGVRPAVAATASCPTPTHATEMPTPCIVSGFFTNAAKLHHSESYRFVCGRLRFQTVFLFCEDVDDGLVPDPHSPPRTTRAAHFE
uniref:Uncharacterized protein LOC116945807 isoform X2 n=1 Tax=Petromyzon marinus TaxID=7757 RepID=A0AAJ7TE87_PETMA|nr:uncharacterized protein LOC116945807 isoform X2 [Petromyzon marinus]